MFDKYEIYKAGILNVVFGWLIKNLINLNFKPFPKLKVFSNPYSESHFHCQMGFKMNLHAALMVKMKS